MFVNMSAFCLLMLVLRVNSINPFEAFRHSDITLGGEQRLKLDTSHVDLGPAKCRADECRDITAGCLALRLSDLSLVESGKRNVHLWRSWEASNVGPSLVQFSSW